MRYFALSPWHHLGNCIIQGQATSAAGLVLVTLVGSGTPQSHQQYRLRPHDATTLGLDQCLDRRLKPHESSHGSKCAT